MGVFNRIFAELAAKVDAPDTVVIDATHLKAHRTVASLQKKGGDVPRRIGRTKGGMNAKLHAVTDGYGRPVALLLSEGQMGDHKGAALLLNSLPPAKQMIAGRGYDSTWYREALRARGITPCISSRKNRKIPAKYSKTLYKKRYKVECMFGKFKDWRRISKRYDCCAHVIWPAHTFCTSRN